MTSPDEAIARSLDALRARVSGLPAALEAIRRDRPELPDLGPPGSRRIAVTAAGIAEGPARFATAMLSETLGHAARFVPLSAFCTGAPAQHADTLLVFSQGLSPNARLALARLGDFRDAWLVTATRPDDHADPGTAAREVADLAQGHAHLRLIHHGPDDEGGMLLRVLGPSSAAYVAAGWALDYGVGAGLDAVPEHVAACLDRPMPAPALPECDVALIAAGGYDAWVHGLAWSWQEGLWAPLPPVWDVLQVAHGPLQATWNHPLTVLALTHADAPAESRLFDRLEATLPAERHRVVRLEATLPAPWSWFEHHARVCRLVLEGVERAPRPLDRWPGLGRDGALYDVANPDSV